MHRDEIENAVAALDINLCEHIEFVLMAMQDCAETPGIAGLESAD